MSRFCRVIKNDYANGIQRYVFLLVLITFAPIFEALQALTGKGLNFLLKE